MPASPDQLKEIFNLYDEELDGKIDGTQIGDVVRAAGLKPTNAMVVKASGQEFKRKGEKRITFEEWLPIYEQLAKEKKFSNSELSSVGPNPDPLAFSLEFFSVCLHKRCRRWRLSGARDPRDPGALKSVATPISSRTEGVRQGRVRQDSRRRVEAHPPRARRASFGRRGRRAPQGSRRLRRHGQLRSVHQEGHRWSLPRRISDSDVLSVLSWFYRILFYCSSFSRLQIV
ncbi:hypothetical protein L596_024339 [Steinernema carpocapsae]|uniref:EF-hand domain-containing protein n=1 Tax=Steinernema carpocapsae TaxID=34508 RepID=A0A4V5ZZP6_STECR|nr:hypothetical protein L596_024339 [Steinernema carpocapsae]